MKLFEKNSTKISMKKETVDYLVNTSGGATLDRIRYLIANLYNCHSYPNVELFSMIRNSDKEHQELIMDIIEINQSKYGEACFLMIDKLAPLLIKKFRIENTVRD